MRPAETRITADGVARGEPLESISHLRGGPRIDDLLASAAERAPRRLAIRSPYGDVRYDELDARVTECARAVRSLAGGPDEVVALALALHPSFPTAFFGIVRSGNVPALVNPYLHEEALTHVLGLAQAGVAIVPPGVYRRLVAIRDRLPALHTVVVTHRDAELDAEAAPPRTLDELIVEAPDGPSADVRPDEEAVACLQFTSGTTGAAKGVRLTHRNLTVNAAQAAYAHQVTGSSVVFDHLPTFHLMHLTIPVTAAATLVLWPGDDPADAVRAAARFGATHYYSLPARLSRLAADPRLEELAVPTLRAILSGGSELPITTAERLWSRFGVPVVQGYGLQETSPLTHSDRLDEPRLRSCGPPVPGTECRIVDVDTRAVLPCRTNGEVQVRGRQLMKGYLGHERVPDVDQDGWFSTGDVGHLDEDGWLFLVDRLKDVFKCDNWLVAPTEIEQVLRRHPTVADCAVVDYPDALSGAVAYGLVVPRGEGAEPAELADFVASRLPYYQHLRHVELVTAIPRSPTGKVQRRELRERVRANGSGGAYAVGGGS